MKDTKDGAEWTLEFPDFYLVNVYTPNSQDGLRRLGYRIEWEDAFRAYLCALAERKGVVVCGDMNVAHERPREERRLAYRLFPCIRKASGQRPER